jgi:hypothetical protein
MWKKKLACLEHNPTESPSIQNNRKIVLPYPYGKKRA